MLYPIRERNTKWKYRLHKLAKSAFAFPPPAPQRAALLRTDFMPSQTELNKSLKNTNTLQLLAYDSSYHALIKLMFSLKTGDPKCFVTNVNP
jgi:hypothetical protein